ncbi:MAG TPA: hypothetical protein VNQ77_12965 [Frankiaceae bacterium]|nr:hypothetical protein [Frankiaceae bacterium]
MRWTKVLLAAALALGAAPALADGAGTDARTAGTTRASRAEWDRQRELIAERLSDARTHAAGAEFDYAYADDAGDLDGDGKRDVVDFRWHVAETDTGYEETLRIATYRGTDGTALWNVTVPVSSFVFATPAKVGVDGKAGIVVLAFEDTGDSTDVGGAWTYRTTVYSYDGAGRPLYVTPLGGSDGYTPSGYGAGYADVDELLDAVPGGATDLLVHTEVFAGAGDPAGVVDEGRSAAQFGLLDGATGTVRPFGTPIVAEWGSGWGWTVGDLDKDGLDDVVLEAETDTGTTLTAYAAKDAAKLWTLTRRVDDGWERYLTLDDATGDGRADFGIVTQTFGGIVISPGKPITSSPARSTVSLVNGATGKVLWTKEGSRLYVLGNADRKAGAEIAVGQSLDDGGFTVAAYTGSGRRVWSVTRRVKGGMYTSLLTVGDATGDGITDIGYGVRSGYDKGRREEGTIDGRTGRIRRDPRPELFATLSALDGRGTDLLETSSRGGYLSLTAWNGAGSGKLWTVAVKAAGSFAATLPISLDGDKCGDVVAALYGGNAFTDVVISGATGKPLWVLSRSGEDAPKVTKPSFKAHKVYRRSC